jgi:GNAT superfamily N-acetyltransferase
MSSTDVDESLGQLVGAFAVFAQASPRGEGKSLPRIRICSANIRLAALNVAAPAHGQGLCRGALAAQEYFRSRGRDGTLIVPEAWVAGSALAASGIERILQLTGMAASALTEPLRPGALLEIRRAADRATIDAVGEVNALAYRKPAEWGREAVAVESVWRERVFACAGSVGGRAVAAAATVPVNGVLYVAWVATLPEHRRRGYGECVMRASLREAARATGLSRTALHATAAGFPMYLRMGYRPVCRLLGYRLPAGNRTPGGSRLFSDPSISYNAV